MPLLHEEFEDSLLVGLADTWPSDTAFTTNLANYTTNLTDFEMEDFEEGLHYRSECPPYEAMALTNWTKLESGETLLVAKLPNVDHDKRQAWIDDDKTSVHVRAERVVPAQGARCLPEHVQLTIDGSHEVFEAASLLPPEFDFAQIVLRETDAGLEFSFPANDTALDDEEADDTAPDDEEADDTALDDEEADDTALDDEEVECPHYEPMQVTDWKVLPSGEFELEAILPGVKPGQAKVELTDDKDGVHMNAWRMHEDCFPEGTQTAISDDGQNEIFERVILFPPHVDVPKVLVFGTALGFRVVAPLVVIEDENATVGIAAEQREDEESFPDDEFEEDWFDHNCPQYHPLQVSPWRMTILGFQLVVALPGVDPEEFQINLHAGTNRLSVRASRPVPKEGLLCLPITTQVSPDGSQELVDILILMPHGCGASYISEDFEHGIKITVPFLASPSQPGFGLSLAPALDPPRKLADVLKDALKFAEENPTPEEQFWSPEEETVEEEAVEEDATVEEEAIEDESILEPPPFLEPLLRKDSASLRCPEYEGMTSQDWQIVDGGFMLDVTMPGVPPEMRKAEFTEDGLLHIVGLRSLSAANLPCLPLRAVTTVSLADGLQEVLDAQVALPLGGDATRVATQKTPTGMRLRMPIVVGGADTRKAHEV